MVKGKSNADYADYADKKAAVQSSAGLPLCPRVDGLPHDTNSLKEISHG
jgi:hypothetical protein